MLELEFCLARTLVASTPRWLSCRCVRTVLRIAAGTITRGP
ncbi:hypothetical protein E2C01_082443 [Portunus trituberculatus]|uniref:Uncharacterized protein n=1 Tax=Portunus trituberculatus TaxID=210409 RepID=A0A5B7J1P1_PORTR|nr:hypothetical protein [Portunus trituberculatus]